MESLRSSKEHERGTTSHRRLSGEERKRTPVTAIFGFLETIPASPPTTGNPILKVEEVTADWYDVKSLDGPVRTTKSRPRPFRSRCPASQDLG